MPAPKLRVAASRAKSNDTAEAASTSPSRIELPPYENIALVLQGGGALFPAKAPDRLERWRLGAAATSLLGLFILAFGDGVQFIVLTLSARAELVWLAPLGATLGSLAVIAPAALLGEAGWRALPLRSLRIGIGILFLIVGLWLGVGALRLI